MTFITDGYEPAPAKGRARENGVEDVPNRS